MRRALLAGALLAVPVAVFAGPPAPPVHWSVAGAPHDAVKPGGKFDVTVAGAIDPGWHLYALDEPDGGPIATQVGLAEGDPAEVLRVTSAKPVVKRDSSFGMDTGMFETNASFTLHLQATPGSSAVRGIAVLVRYQACNNQVCLPPRTDTVPVSFNGGR